MLEDEFNYKQIPRRMLTFGCSPKQSMIAIPKAIFALPPEEKAIALKELEENLSQYKRKEN
ncbi:hypothetical protein LGW85_09280 [Streptococcus mutans]|nr:hypothetical protein [Streptococcus mutans]MCB5110521.1 hypothetical protein [Streptococcus mutans]MCB5113631.1 hypothetical protein [Streptococcus mutans]